MNLEKVLRKARRTYLIKFFIGLALSIISVIIFLLFFRFPIKIYNTLFCVTIFIIINLSTYFLAKNDKSNYYKLYEEEIVQKSLKSNFQNVVCENFCNKNQLINNINLFTGKRIFTTNYVSFDYNNIPIEVIQTLVEEHKHYADGEHSYTSIFSGMIYLFNLKKEINLSANIVSKYYLDKNEYNKDYILVEDYKKNNSYSPELNSQIKTDYLPMSKIDIESKDFQDWFSLYSNSKISQTFLTEKILPILLKIREKYGRVFLSISNNKVYFGINTSSKLFKKKIFNKINPSLEIADLNEHYSLIKQLINNLNNVEELKEKNK